MPAEGDRLVLLKWHESLAHLREMTQHAGWEQYAGYLGRILDENVEALIASDPPGPATDWRKGYIMGVRRALNLPAEITRNVSAAKGN